MEILITVIVKFILFTISGMLYLYLYKKVSNNRNLSLMNNVFLSILLIISASLCFANSLLYLIILLVVIFI